MATAHLVEANGAAIPAIGLGTYGLTGEGCSQAVQWAIEAGYRHLDTATMYGNEREVGIGLKAAGLPRAEVFVTTKVWRDDIAPELAWQASSMNCPRAATSFRPASTVMAAVAS